MASPTPPTDGPYLAAALLCEKVLIEGDGVPSIIRAVDRWTVTASGQAPEHMPATQISLTLFLAFKSGQARGRNTVNVRLELPSGIRMPTQSLPVLFEGDDRGANLILQLSVTADLEGVYWFDILLEDKLLTRVPLRLLYQTFGPPS